MGLIAKVPILYKNRWYLAGEVLPEDDREMVEAWKRAETVREESQENETEAAARKKARQITAEAGIPIPDDSAENALLGKVPRSNGRKKQ